VPRRLKPALLALVAMLVAAATAAFALSTGGDNKQPPPARVEEQEAAPGLLVIRRRGGVPRSWAARLRRTPGVTAVAQIARTQVLLRRSRLRDGRTVDAVRAGFAIPLDVVVVERRLARMVPEAARELRTLDSDTALLSRGSARLRRLGVGDRLRLAGGRRLRVAGLVDDQPFGFSELVLGPHAAGGGKEATRQLVVATTEPKRIERRFGRSDLVRIRPLSLSGASGPRLVARPLEIKARFGEFAVDLPYGSDWIRIDPHWLGRNIVTRRVPILGAVTCNRRLIPPLRRAQRALERRGLARVVDRADYAGCFAPRRIPGSGSLSLHAWGLAIDINAAANPRLGESRQDRRLVRAMEDAGFTWGGRWPTVPDPMHFELHP
jgi:hypothetical protein